MNINRSIHYRIAVLAAAMLAIAISSSQLKADTGTCGGASTTLPFTDVPAGNIFFCSIAEAYFSALTNGADATHYSPSANVTREQMAAFITRTMDQSVKRSSKRAALRQFWTTQGENNLALTTVGNNPNPVESDGADVWVADSSSNVSRVRASDGRLLESWTGAAVASAILVAGGNVWVTGATAPGTLYKINPSLAAGSVTTITSDLGVGPQAISYDGLRIWAANVGFPGSVSIVSFRPLSVATISTGFQGPTGIIYDGMNMWVTDSDNTLKKLDASGDILMSVPVGTGPAFPAFDGTNIWVPNQASNSVSVVRATGGLTGTVLATLTGNGLATPFHAAFDGERILITNLSGDCVSLWNATTLAPIGTFSTGAGTTPYAACSDGLNFWITFFNTNKLARF